MINNTYAIIKTGGKQIKAETGQAIWIEKTNDEVDKQIAFTEVIALSDNGKITIGTPVIEGAKVLATVQKHGKGPKLIIFRTKAKSNWSRKQGHRQPYTRLLVEQILLNGKIIAKMEDVAPKMKIEEVAKPVEAKKVVKPVAKKVEVAKPAEAKKVVKPTTIKVEVVKPAVVKKEEVNFVDEQVSSKLKNLQEKAIELNAGNLQLADINGIGEKTLTYMHDHQIKTIGDLVKLDKKAQSELISGLPGLNSEDAKIKKQKFINFLEQAHSLLKENNK